MGRQLFLAACLLTDAALLLARRAPHSITEIETMAAKKIQRRYVKKSVYSVVGPSKKVRKLTFVGRFKIGKIEHLIFKVQRKASKTG